MQEEKKSLLKVIGIPSEFGVVLLTFALLLMLSPYLGGTDLGIFNVPSFSQSTTNVLYVLGPIMLLGAIFLFVPLFGRASEQSPVVALGSVGQNSKYRIQNIEDIVKAESASHGINIDGIVFGDRLHINDLERIAVRALFPERSSDQVKQIINDARATAFSRKYAEPREDEKLVEVSKIQLDGLRPWNLYFTDLLKDLGINDYDQLDILNVGIGNGHAEEVFLGNLRSFIGVDISEEALQFAVKKYPQMTRFKCSAEDLKPIANNSIDLYLSLRTFQSTLFNRRAALHEAYRVLHNGGVIVLSVPIMYLQEDGRVLTGLIPPGSTSPDIAYARQAVERIKEYMMILNFRDVEVDERSPFEIYLTARR